MSDIRPFSFLLAIAVVTMAAFILSSHTIFSIDIFCYVNITGDAGDVTVYLKLLSVRQLLLLVLSVILLSSKLLLV